MGGEGSKLFANLKSKCCKQEDYRINVNTTKNCTSTKRGVPWNC